MSRRDLKVGDRVAIDAKENSNKKLIGVAMKFGTVDQGSRLDIPMNTSMVSARRLGFNDLLDIIYD